MADKPKVKDVLGGLGGSKSALEVPPELDLEETEADEDEGVGEAEVSAMKLFSKATSPEQKAEALKMFLKACGVY